MVVENFAILSEPSRMQRELIMKAMTGIRSSISTSETLDIAAILFLRMNKENASQENIAE